MKRSLRVIKRDGNLVGFDSSKIHDAIIAAFRSEYGVELDFQLPRDTMARTSTIATRVTHKIEFGNLPKDKISVETIQDLVEKALMDSGHQDIARRYIIYREDRRRERTKKETV